MEQPDPPYFKHQSSCLVPGGGTDDDDCHCTRAHVRKENIRLGRPNVLPKNNWTQANYRQYDQDPYAHVLRIQHNEDSMDTLRAIFPTAEANVENWVLFSTGGTYGNADTIEDVENEIAKNGFTFDGLTCVVIHPRIVCMKYMRVYPETPEDFEFLKKLRESSIVAVSKIGK